MLGVALCGVGLWMASQMPSALPEQLESTSPTIPISAATPTDFPRDIGRAKCPLSKFDSMLPQMKADCGNYLPTEDRFHDPFKIGIIGIEPEDLKKSVMWGTTESIWGNAEEGIDKRFQSFIAVKATCCDPTSQACKAIAGTLFPILSRNDPDIFAEYFSNAFGFDEENSIRRLDFPGNFTFKPLLENGIATWRNLICKLAI